LDTTPPDILDTEAVIGASSQIERLFDYSCSLMVDQPAANSEVEMLGSPRPPRNRINVSRPVTTARQPIAVIATLRWDGDIMVDVIGLAIAWTHNAVKVQWTGDYAARADWLPLIEIRRAPPGTLVQHGSTAATPPVRGPRLPPPPR
jgi:hypothetical protein